MTRQPEGSHIPESQTQPRQKELVYRERRRYTLDINGNVVNSEIIEYGYVPLDEIEKQYPRVDWDNSVHVDIMF